MTLLLERTLGDMQATGKEVKDNRITLKSGTENRAGHTGILAAAR